MKPTDAHVLEEAVDILAVRSEHLPGTFCDESELFTESLRFSLGVKLFIFELGFDFSDKEGKEYGVAQYEHADA